MKRIGAVLAVVLAVMFAIPAIAAEPVDGERGAQVWMGSDPITILRGSSSYANFDADGNFVAYRQVKWMAKRAGDRAFIIYLSVDGEVRVDVDQGDDPLDGFPEIIGMAQSFFLYADAFTATGANPGRGEFFTPVLKPGVVINLTITPTWTLEVVKPQVENPQDAWLVVKRSGGDPASRTNALRVGLAGNVREVEYNENGVASYNGLRLLGLVSRCVKFRDDGTCRRNDLVPALVFTTDTGPTGLWIWKWGLAGRIEVRQWVPTGTMDIVATTDGDSAFVPAIGKVVVTFTGVSDSSGFGAQFQQQQK